MKLCDYTFIRQSLNKFRKGSFLYVKFIKLLFEFEKSQPTIYRNCRYVGEFNTKR